MGPNQINKSGAIAKGGIALNISIIGWKISFTILFILIIKPQRIPNKIPIVPPIYTLMILAIKWGYIPFAPPPCALISGELNKTKKNLLKIKIGEGNLDGPKKFARKYQQNIKNKKPKEFLNNLFDNETNVI